ncbi:MAG TPA: hypothetical protein VMM58_04030 [Bacteroidota bacterium]|nr:hypothetical protein [Bacteroidota bacterium]
MGCRFSPSHDDFSVYGYWEWVKTQGAWTGSINTPALSGYTAKVLFQENGVAQFYRNDTLVTQIPFTLSTTNILGDRKDVFVIHWSNKNYPDDQCILFSGNDTLHLTARGTEISHYYYVRVHH